MHGKGAESLIIARWVVIKLGSPEHLFSISSCSRMFKANVLLSVS